MSGPGSPADPTVTGTDKPKDDAPASASLPADAPPDGQDAKSPADASSAPVEGAKQPDAKPTLLDVLKTAAELPDAEGKSPTPAKDGKDKAGPEVAPDKPDEKDDSKLSFHNHPRWHEVNAQNRQLKEQVQTLEPDADQYRKIQGFMDTHKLTPDEVGEGFIIMAMAKNGDPRVIQKLDEFRNRVALNIGEAVPPDIQEKIDAGEVSEAAGKEMAKARATLKLSETREAERAATAQREQDARQREALSAAQMGAVHAWEVEQRKSDPDFAKKEKAVARYARALMQEHGNPTNTEQAVQLIKAAYAEVNRDFAQALPPKTAVPRMPIAPSSNGAKAAPKSLREVVEQAALSS